MRRLAQQFFDLIRKRSKLRRDAKKPTKGTFRLHLEALEDRFLPATSVLQALPAALTGTAFIDHNNNSNLDAGELTLPGATITLSGKNETGNAVNTSVVTDVNGVYKFMQVSPGTYNLSISASANLLAGLGTAGSRGGIVSGSTISAITITDGETLVGYNLAVEGLNISGVSLRQVMSETLLVDGIPVFSSSAPQIVPGSGLTYVDGAAPRSVLIATGSAGVSGFVKDGSSNGIANVTIALTGVTGPGTNAGLPINQTTTTGATGAYSFSGLAAGVYSLHVISQPAGFRAGAPTLGSLDGYIRQNDLIAGIDLASAAAGTGYNFNEITVAEPSAATPTMEAHLLNDTAGASGTTSDSITGDDTIAGVISGAGTVTTIIGTIDGGAAAAVGTARADGSFIVSPAALDQLAGGHLADGFHTLGLTAAGSAGTAATSISFTLHTPTAALTPVVHLDSISDPGQTGRPTSTVVTVQGTTTPNAAVTLVSGSTKTPQTADGSGNFSFTGQTLSNGANDFSIIATDTSGNTSQTDKTFVVNRTPTGTIANVTTTAGSANQVLDLAADFTDPDTSSSVVTVHTSAGDVKVQLNDGQAPQTVTNFLDYVKSGRFDADTLFNRNASNSGTPFVLQGGGFNLSLSPTTINPVLVGPTVKNEFPTTVPAGGVNVRGTIAMAKASGDPNSATNQFFFNLSDNHTNLDTQNSGFTVFATVVDGFSQRVLDNLAAEPTFNEQNAPAGAKQATVQEVKIFGNPTGGTFKLSLNNNVITTADIAFNASAADVQLAVADLPSPLQDGKITVDRVKVTGSAGDWIITFAGTLAGTNTGDLAGTDVPQFTVFTNSTLTGGNSPAVAVTVMQHGSAQNQNLTDLPLVNYTNVGNFPNDATKPNFETFNVGTSDITRNSEFLSYTVASNADPTVADAVLDPVFNNRLTIRFLKAGTTTIAIQATDLSGQTTTQSFTVTVN